MPRDTQATSKAFRATLPGALHDSALERLQAWARDNSSRSAMWRKDEGVVWVCTREKPRTQEAFMRHLRDLFAALYIQERPPRTLVGASHRGRSKTNHQDKWPDRAGRP